MDFVQFGVIVAILIGVFVAVRIASQRLSPEYLRAFWIRLWIRCESTVAST